MDEQTVFENRKVDLYKLIREAFYAAEKAHEVLFKASDEKRNEIIAALYLNKAVALMSAAKAVYASNYEILSSSEVNGIFRAFDTFESEFLTNISSDHSHQWTDIEFTKFQDTVKDFVY